MTTHIESAYILFGLAAYRYRLFRDRFVVHAAVDRGSGALPFIAWYDCLYSLASIFDVFPVFRSSMAICNNTSTNMDRNVHTGKIVTCRADTQNTIDK